MDPKFLKPYDASATEKNTYETWEKSGFFNPDNLPDVDGKAREPYSIVLPPPNVTGTLHMGSALMIVIEDILIRFERMRGKATLWVPGTDSAAIATQAKVEKDIQKKEGKNRHDLGRDELLKRIDAFVEENKSTILSQLRSMGASVDWSRYAYTMDANRYRAVMQAFKSMYETGLIYRGARIVNWDPKGQTTISDDELVYKEEKTTFYYFKYGPFVIGTARPETKFGDKYVVMHPDDTRYAKYTHGQKIDLEWINGPITATVIKDTAIDMEFGTGVMTITPWHSVVDFEIAERHKLDKEQIIDKYGKLLPIAGEFAGQKITEARPKIVEKLRAKGLIEKEEPYVHNIATAERTDGLVEPQIMLQWFVDVNKPFPIPHSEITGIESGSEVSLKDIMIKSVEGGDVKILTERFEKIYFHWIHNLRDWCISRQIWFGHRIPVWYCLACGKEKIEPNIKSKWFIVRHGQTEYNRDDRYQGGESDSPLTEEGRAQAALIGEKLKDQNIELILTSELGRAKETAEIIAKATGAEVVSDPAMNERHFGELGGLTTAEVLEKYGETRVYNKKIPGVETYQDLESRVWKAFNEHKQNHHKKNVVIVSHGSATRMLMKQIKNMDPDDAMSSPHIKNGEMISLEVAEKPCACGNDLYEQDPDVLDTWFSSALWTFSTLGWPEKTSDLKRFHPTAVIETAYDIIFFWVARMILMSGFHLGQVPFKTVYFHGLVRDEKGQKISKSLGNNIDPVDMGAKYGTDAVRVSLIVGMAPGTDSKISEAKIRGYKNFANKIWNIARFVLENLDEKGFDKDYTNSWTEDDAKDMADLESAVLDTTKHLEDYRIDLAFDRVYHYVWHTFADIVIEKSKASLKEGTPEEKARTSAKMYIMLTTSLKLLHPFMPFVTEEIWSHLPKKDGLLIVSEWPKKAR